MDVRIFWKGDGWRITVDHATKLVADDWAEVDAFMKKLLSEKEDKETAYKLQEAEVEAHEGDE